MYTRCTIRFKTYGDEIDAPDWCDVQWMRDLSYEKRARLRNAFALRAYGNKRMGEIHDQLRRTVGARRIRSCFGVELMRL